MVDELMLALALVIVALILGIVILAQSKLGSLAGWAIVALSLAHILGSGVI